MHKPEIKGSNDKPCKCNHKLSGTGVFFYSLDVILCNTCKGFQKIKKTGY